mmetsp:Transcript_3233/g.5849  ORF Transcript_3233/g.5849 Transcript_3233/m.5849 type:complete len:387 (+) Transcript_3233:50-1210(+)
MWVFTFFFTCLVCESHGRQVQTSKQREQINAQAKGQIPLKGTGSLEQKMQTHADWKRSQEHAALKNTSMSMRRLTTFLLTHSPPAAFGPSSPLAFHSHNSLRPCRVHSPPAVPRARCASMSSAVLHDFTGPAITFFSNLRTPAAVIAATAIKEAFKLWGDAKARHETRTSPAWTLLRYAYMLLLLLSTGAEVVVMFVATRASAQLSTLKLNSQASSLIEFLLRELEFEFVTVRFLFATGLFAFVLALGLRVRYVLRRYTDLSIAVMLTHFYACLAMMAYANDHPISYGGYFGLVVRYFRLHWHFFIEQCLWGQPMKIFANLAMVASILFFCRAGFRYWKNFDAEPLLQNVRLFEFEEEVPDDDYKDEDILPTNKTFESLPANKTFH